MEGYYYEAKQEECENYGEHYVSYAIFTKEEEQVVFICHDVTMDQEEAGKLCLLLNTYGLEPEQAKYVVEDYIMEKYLPEERGE